MQLSFCRRVYVSLAKGLGLKKLFYYLFVNNKIIDILSSRVLSMVVPPIVGLYYGTLDIWGDDWDIVTKYKSQHEFTFTILAGMTLLILFVKGVSETFKDIVSDRYEALLESLIVFFNSLLILNLPFLLFAIVPLGAPLSLIKFVKLLVSRPVIPTILFFLSQLSKF